MSMAYRISFRVFVPWGIILFILRVSALLFFIDITILSLHTSRYHTHIIGKDIMICSPLFADSYVIDLVFGSVVWKDPINLVDVAMAREKSFAR